MQLRRLPSIQIHLDDIRREQCEPQNPADVGSLDLLGGRQIGDRGALAAFQEPLPAIGQGDGLDHAVINTLKRHRPIGGSFCLHGRL